MPVAPLEAFMAARTEQSVRAAVSAGQHASRALSDTLDAAVRELAAPVARAGVALVALGSYGRREQCRHSDIDIMLLVTGAAADVVNAVLYPLWDTGVKVGHSVRTVEQAIESGHQNVETLTSLLDARLVCGDAALYARFVEARRRLFRRERGRMFEQLRERRWALVAAEPWQLQEPDIKTGRGGLRDLQSTHWLAAAEAFAAGTEPPPLAPELASAQDVLLATRHALHVLSARADDQLRQDVLSSVAQMLGIERPEAGRRVFAAMRRIDAEAERVFGWADEPAPAQSAISRWLPWRRATTRPAEVPTAGTTDLETLMATLRQASPRSLDSLPAEPWLARLLPEWEVLRCLPHIAPFHRHPVDVHSFRAVAEVRRGLEEDAEETGTVLVGQEIADRDELLLAALLHDIGKGHDGDHSTVGAVIVERFASRVGLDAERAGRLVAITRQHLLLPTVATRRDIADERVIRETAELAGDAHTLRLLYLVSVADARASGPDVWSAWKAQLMRSLFLRVLGHLEAEGGAAAATVRLRDDAIAALAPRFGASAVYEHLAKLPATYLLSTRPEVIGDHLALIERAAGGTAVDHDRVGDLDRLTIVTPDRPGILSLLAGTLAVHNVTVLGGVAYTRDDGVAMDVMYVADGLGHGIDDRRWARVVEAVPLALAGEFPIEERLAETRRAYASATPPPAPIPTTVLVDNAGSDGYSIVEVNAADRLGLLYAITNALRSLALDIHVAKVDTVGREVVDAFYVRRENGRRVEADDEIDRLRQRVMEAVSALDG
ncbi:MAG: HD domain-containing protein [Chloroflexi bacterium]|nr:MAG: HD domain-containing protein [Chloroflexota bacterium]